MYENEQNANYQRENYPEFTTKGEEIAAAMGEGWTYEPSPWARYPSGKLVGPNFGISLGTDKDRLTLSWDKPNEYSVFTLYVGGEKRSVDSISVAKNRPANAIASEITRRLIPQIVEVDQLSQVRLQEHRDHHNGRNAIVAQFKALDRDGKLVCVKESKPNAAGVVEDIAMELHGADSLHSLKCQIGGSLRIEGYISHEVGLLLTELLRAEREGKIHQIGIMQTRWGDNL